MNILPEQSDIINPEDPRVRLAAERTILAWIRTGLALMGFGFVVARFGLFLHELVGLNKNSPPQNFSISLWTGTGLVIVGVLVNFFAAVQHARGLKRLRKNESYYSMNWSFGSFVAAVLGIIGVGMAFYLIVLGRKGA